MMIFKIAQINNIKIQKSFIQQKMSKLQLSHILGSSTSKIQHLGFAQDFLIYISGSFIVFYSPVVDQQISYLKHSSPYISCIAISPCQQFLAVCSTACSDRQKTLDSNNKKNNIVIYKLGEIGVSSPVVSVQLKGHKYIIDHIVFSPDSKYLVSVCNRDGSMFVWDCKTGQRITQNKNSKSINCIKFMYEKQSLKPGKKDNSVYIVTSGRGNCKIWTFYTQQNPGNLCKVQQQQQWIISGRNIPFNKKFATKQFIGICFWGSYILLLTTDGLLCMIMRTQKQEKLQKCIDLMITKTTSMDLYRNTVMCGGDNALIKVIDLQSLELIKKFPRPPPIKKQNISKDYEQEQVMSYQQSEEFPQCKGIKTIGNNIFSQFIITIYENLTMFIWRPQPQEMVAMRSIITHSSIINSVKILEQFENDLTFFSTISQDNTLRIWHIYKKCIYNRESIDIAKLIGINRNAYCRNLTRIIYMESEKQVTCIAGFCKKSVACIAHREFIMYSLVNFQVICHQLLDCDAVALQIIDKLSYIGLQNGKVVIYQIPQNEDKLFKLREIQFKNKIKFMKIIKDETQKGNCQTFLLIMTSDTSEAIIYSLKKSKVIHIQKAVSCCSSVGHNIVLCKKDRTIHLYNILNNKSAQFLSLKHQMSAQTEESILNVSCNLLWVVVVTSANKLIVANFSPAIVCTQQFTQNINDVALSQSGQIILVGDFGDILIYRMQGSHGYTGMQQQIKKWMEINDMSWLDGSVWTRKKSQRQLTGSVVDSIKLKSSVENNPRGSMKLELPNMQIKYKTQKNDQSIFNPSHILEQMKNIYKNLDELQKEKKNNSNVINQAKQTEQNKKSNVPQNKIINIEQDEDGLQEIKKNINKNRPPLHDAESKRDSKKRIFKLSQNVQSRKQEQFYNLRKPTQSKEQTNFGSQFKNNLVDSIIVPGNSANETRKQTTSDMKMNPSSNAIKQQPKKQMNSNNFSQFLQSNKSGSLHQPQVRDAGQVSKVFQQFFNSNQGRNQQMFLSLLEQKLNDSQFTSKNNIKLKRIYQKLQGLYPSQSQNLIDRSKVMNRFSMLSKQFLNYISMEQNQKDI